MKRTGAFGRNVPIALGLFVVAAYAYAGGCAISSSGLAFGAYPPLSFAGKLASADRTSDATVSLVCTGIATGGDYSIALGPSPTGNSMSPRYLANSNGGADMAFNVYREASFSTIWGDSFTGMVLGGTIPVGDSARSHTVFGRIPAGQSTLKPGSFSGSLSMTITYNP